MYFSCTPGAWEVGNQMTQGLSVLLNNTSGSPTAKSLHSQGMPEIICQTSLSSLCIFHTFSKTQRKSEGKQVHRTWLNISLLPEWKMQTLVSIKNEDSAGWQPLPLCSHLLLEMLFGKCDSPTLEGCPARLPAQVWGLVWNSDQDTEHTNFPKSWRHLQMLRKKSHNEQEKCRTQNCILVSGKFQIDLTHNMPQEFAVFLGAAIPQWITVKVGGSKLGRVPVGLSVLTMQGEDSFYQSTGEMAPVWNKQKDV